MLFVFVRGSSKNPIKLIKLSFLKMKFCTKYIFSMSHCGRKYLENNPGPWKVMISPPPLPRTGGLGGQAREINVELASHQ